MPYIRRSPIWSDPRVKPPFGSVEVDWGHPLARNLVACWLFNEAAGEHIRDLTYIQRAVITNPATVTWTTSRAGIGLRSTATAGATIGVTVSPSLNVSGGTKALTFDTLISPTDSGDSYATLLANPAIGGFWYRTANRKLSYINGAEFSNTTTISHDGTYHHYLTAIASDGNGVFYLDGRADGTFSAGTTTLPLNSMFNDTSTETLDGHSIFQRVWYRVLTSSEALWLYAEPYAFLRPILRRRYFVPAAGGADYRQRRARRHPETFARSWSN